MNDPRYQSVLVSVSGGADSDVMMDIIHRCDIKNKAIFCWYNTGLEYQATKDHLRELERKYGITIRGYKSKKSVPSSCKEFGQPFLNKIVSGYIERLQRHGFDFANGNRPFDELYREYPRCKSALLWWCNLNQSSLFHIARNRFLKRFLIEHPPEFKISQKCCQYAKKNIAHSVLKDLGVGLNIMGVRKAEGGIRSVAYKSCFLSGDDHDTYMPLFWYTNQDRETYEKHFNIQHSKCYTEYGLRRTGCAGCPFGRDFEGELEIIQTHEPKLYKACNTIFGDSYEYTRRYRQYAQEMKDNGIPDLG